MLELGQDEIAKYPFLADAGQYLKDKGFTLEQFGVDPDLKQLISKAYERIQVAADGKIYKSDLIDNQVSKEAALPREVFSFLLAIPVIAGAGLLTALDVNPTHIANLSGGSILTAFMSSFLVGWVALTWLMKLISRGQFHWFGLYCMAIGIFSLSF